MAATSYNAAQNTASPVIAISGRAAKRRAAKTPEDVELRLATLERERRDIHQELFEAAQVQRRLSGPRGLRRGRYEIASEVFPVRHLAGDFVSAVDIGSQTWIALGDITGKGLAAAMWFTHLVSLMRCLAMKYKQPAPVMRELNEDLCGLQPSPPFTSMVLLTLDHESGKAEYSNAGHPAPLLLREGEVQKLEAGGPLLGVVDGAAYESANLLFRTGDLLLACTDGVLEARNAADEDFGPSRLVSVARQHAQEPAQAVLFSILGAVQDFGAQRPPRDDISLLVVRAS